MFSSASWADPVGAVGRRDRLIVAILEATSAERQRARLARVRTDKGAREVSFRQLVRLVVCCGPMKRVRRWSAPHLRDACRWQSAPRSFERTLVAVEHLRPVHQNRLFVAFDDRFDQLATRRWC